MEENNKNKNELQNVIQEENFDLDKNPNIKYKEELYDDCIYDYYPSNFYCDVYHLNNEKEKIYISFISNKEHNTIKILEICKDSHNIILTLTDNKNKVLYVKHYFNTNNNKDYLLSTDIKGNLLLYEIIASNDYKIKHKIEQKMVRNKRWTCQTINQNPFLPGNKMGMGCIYNKPYNMFNPMKKMNNFGMHKFDLFGDMNYENQFPPEPAMVIDYIDCSLLFFTPTANYIFVLYRESASLAMFDLESLESKGRLYDKSSTNSLLQWFNSGEQINYVIVSGNNKIEIINPFAEKDKLYFAFKDNDHLKGGNYAYSILYNFRDNTDFLLSYTKYRINVINLKAKIIISTIEIKNSINSVLNWNKNYLIVSYGENYGKNKCSYLSIIHFDSKKIITQIKDSSIKSSIKKINFNNDISLIISDSNHKLSLWGIN